MTRVERLPLEVVTPSRGAARETNRLALAHLWVAIVAFGVAAAMALMQSLSRASL
jgi:hypothetical protein